MSNRKSSGTVIASFAIPLLSFVMIFGMVAAAVLLREKEIIFPEIAALVTGAWLTEKMPWRVGAVKAVLLMTALGFIGVAAVRYLPFPLALKLPTVLLFAAVLLFLSRSTLLPILSACVLPVLMGTESMIYPLSVFVMSAMIFGLRAVFVQMGLRSAPAETAVVASAKTEITRWGMILLVFVPICLTAIKTGWIFLIAPPLLVTFAEFTYPDSPVRNREIRVFAVAALCAAVGAFSRLFLCEVAALPLLFCTAVILLLVYAVYRILGCMFPPAGALALLPLIIPAEKLIIYPAAVAIGAVILITAAHFIRGFLALQPQNPQKN